MTTELKTAIYKLIEDAGYTITKFDAPGASFIQTMPGAIVAADGSVTKRETVSISCQKDIDCSVVEKNAT